MADEIRERQIREQWQRVTKPAQVSRIDAFDAIPFLLGQLDAVDQVLARRDALDDAPDRVSKIARAINRAKQAEEFIAREGYRRCDIPACNCGSWHDMSLKSHV